MRQHQIENWVLEICQRVENNQQIEDQRVELKTKWPDTTKAARRIAGQANSARGNDILWIIGIDENKSKIIGSERNELSEWISQVNSNFQGISPNFIDLVIPINDVSVVALLFSTVRAPFVVNNPSFGKENGGPVEYEVPWREGTSTHTAKRSNLIRLLSPIQDRPNLELLSGRLIALTNSKKEKPSIYEVYLELYIEIPIGPTIIIPFHRCQAKFKFSNNTDWFSLNQLRLSPPSYFSGRGTTIMSKTIESTADEVIIHAPGRVILKANAEYIEEIHKSSDNVIFILNLLPTISDIPSILNLIFNKVDPHEGETARWEII